MSSTHPRIPTPLPAQLVALREGCARAADEVVRACRPRISSLASRYALAGTDHRDELEQLGGIAAWEAALAYDPERGSFEPLATRAITNSFKRAHRDQVRGGPCLMQGLERAEALGAASVALRGVELADLGECLEPMAAHVFRLLYIEGLTQREAGAVLSISQPRVAQVHRRVVTRLRGEVGCAA